MLHTKITGQNKSKILNEGLIKIKSFFKISPLRRISKGKKVEMKRKGTRIERERENENVEHLADRAFPQAQHHCKDFPTDKFLNRPIGIHKLLNVNVVCSIIEQNPEEKHSKNTKSSKKNFF